MYTLVSVKSTLIYEKTMVTSVEIRKNPRKLYDLRGYFCVWMKLFNRRVRDRQSF